MNETLCPMQPHNNIKLYLISQENIINQENLSLNFDLRHKSKASQESFVFSVRLFAWVIFLMYINQIQCFYVKCLVWVMPLNPPPLSSPLGWVLREIASPTYLLSLGSTFKDSTMSHPIFMIGKGATTLNYVVHGPIFVLNILKWVFGIQIISTIILVSLTFQLCYATCFSSVWNKCGLGGWI